MTRAMAPRKRPSNSNSEEVAIAIAMNTTAFGLIVAIPTIAAYVFLNNTVKKIIDEIDQYSVKLQNLLVSRGKGAQSPLDR